MKFRKLSTPEETNIFLSTKMDLPDAIVEHIKNFCQTFISKVEISESKDNITIKFSIQIKESPILNAFFGDPEIRHYPKEVFLRDYLKILEEIWLFLMEKNLRYREYFFPLSYKYLMKSSKPDPKKLLVLFRMELEDAKRKVKV